MKELFCLLVTLVSGSLAMAQNVSIGHLVPAARLDIRGVAASPTIPGTTSTGVARFAVGPGGGIDIGKMGSSPYLGWVQVGFNGTVTDPLIMQPLGGNVGIGTGSTAPTAKLEVAGNIKIVDGTQGAGKILTSDATGLASWQPPPPDLPAYNQSVGICCQSWMVKNLQVTTYRNGDPIPKVTDPATWAGLTTGAYCYYNNDSTTYAATYGKLYNWYAVNDSRGLAPEGWHIPTKFELTTLSTCLGGDLMAGGPLKEIETTHWASPNNGATNLSGFTALPGGSCASNGSFFDIGLWGNWWTSTEDSAGLVWYYSLANSSDALLHAFIIKKFGLSVRCIKD